jgi:hypothetical protein
MNLMIHPYHHHHILLLEASKSPQVIKTYFKSKDPFLGEEPIALMARLENTFSNDVVYHAHVQTHITDYYPV